MSTYKIEIPESIKKDLQMFADRKHITLEEASARAFALLAIANTVSEQNNTLGVITKSKSADETSKVVGEITGV
ncbi:MAG: hypothetical protein DM484_17000 [Candidatus Methylumidiphilus alinenensis]|uniref:Uncharacterized protein n=1 Tax=Candidatus Methylumidiphilus alinenensis TaxID=2202197 RepID=A0A2W4QZ46_9GAMM|nr:MAG: hypothetical protein DM484_17000 [Candidatus Methylumidiphilus alinenensis]